MAKEYQLAGESGALYNGAQDTEGGIWVRIRDENDRRLATAAVDKQLKNREAATGTLSALDPNSGHLLDYIGEALGRIKDGLNGARPSGAQLDGTPLGAAMASPPDEPAAKGKGKGKRGGKPSTVGDVLKTVPGGPLSPSAPAGGIQWAETVPTPRPEPGQVVRTAQGHATSIDKVIGFDGEANAFRIIDATGWDGLVFVHPATGEWRITGQALDYPEDTPAASSSDAGSDAGGDFPADALSDTTPGASLGDTGAATLAAANATETETPYAPPAAPAAPSPQRARNARHAGLGKPDGKLPATPKATPVAKKAAAKKRK